MKTTTQNPRLDALRRLPKRERVAALRAAMRVAGKDELESLAVELIELGIAEGLPVRGRNARPGFARLIKPSRDRPDDEALIALVSQWGELPETIRRTALAAGAGRWDAIAASILESGDPAELRSLAALIVDAPDPGFGPGLVRLLGHEDAGVALAGDRALVRLAMAALEDVSPEQYGRELAELAARPRLDETMGRLSASGGASALLGAVADAAWAFAEHRCSGALLAAILLLDQPLEISGPQEAESATASTARLHRLLDEASHPSHAPLSVAFKRRGVPVLRERAWRLLTSPGLGAAALERVSRAESGAEHEGMLRDAHLALNPRRARRAALIDVRTRRSGASMTLEPGAPVPDQDTTRTLSVRARRGLPRLAGSMRLDTALGRYVRAPLLDDPDALVRLNAAHAAEPVELADYLFDPDPFVARSAMLRWSTGGQHAAIRWPPRLREAGRARLAGRIGARPEPTLSRLGAEEWERLSPFDPRSPAGRLGARRWLREDPKSFIAQLAERLESDSTTTRIDALLLTRTLRLGERLESSVLAHARNQSEDPRVRATCIVMMGEIPTPASAEVVGEALADTDDRIRANAVEARARRARTPADLATGEPATHAVMIELKDDPHHRVRANALRALLRSGTPNRSRVFEPAAIDGLEAMLADERDTHRIAGVWLAERVLSGAGRGRLAGRWDALARRVASIATGDPSERARTRASRCAARLLAELRSDPGAGLVSAARGSEA